MNRSFEQHWSLSRTLGLMAALFALVLGALMPSAVMASARGGEAVVLCTAEGFKTIHLGEDGAPADLAGAHCAACLLAPQTALPPPPPVEPAFIPSPHRADAVRPIPTAAPTPPSRAPPRPPSTAPPQS